MALDAVGRGAPGLVGLGFAAAERIERSVEERLDVGNADRVKVSRVM